MLRVEQGGESFTIACVAASGEHEVAIEVERLDGAAFIRVTQLPTVLSGAGGLVLRTAQGGERRWPVWWGSVPEASADAPRPVAAMTLDDSAFAAALWGGVTRARSAQAEGDSVRIRAAWLAAAEDAARLGVRTEVGRRLRAAAFSAYESRQAAEMSRLVERAAEVDEPVADPIGHAKLLYTRGLLASLLADWQAEIGRAHV